MGIGQILLRGWQLVWRHKYLVLLAFVAGWGGVVIGDVSPASPKIEALAWLATAFEDEPVETPLPSDDIPAEEQLGATALALSLAGPLWLIFYGALALWLVGLVARAGLIFAAARLDEGDTLTLRAALAGGGSTLYGLAGLYLLLHAPLFLLGALVVGLTGNASAAPPETEGLWFALAFLPLCLAVPYGLFVLLLSPLAQRAVVLDRRGVGAALSHSLHLLGRHLGSFFGLVVALLAGWVLLFICFALLDLLASWLALAATLVAGAIYGAFLSAALTVAYRAWSAAPKPPVP